MNSCALDPDEDIDRSHWSIDFFFLYFRKGLQGRFNAHSFQWCSDLIHLESKYSMFLAFSVHKQHPISLSLPLFRLSVTSLYKLDTRLSLQSQLLREFFSDQMNVGSIIEECDTLCRIRTMKIDIQHLHKRVRTSS